MEDRGLAVRHRRRRPQAQVSARGRAASSGGRAGGAAPAPTPASSWPGPVPGAGPRRRVLGAGPSGLAPASLRPLRRCVRRGEAHRGRTRGPPLAGAAAVVRTR